MINEDAEHDLDYFRRLNKAKRKPHRKTLERKGKKEYTLSLYGEGASFREMEGILMHKFKIKISHETIRQNIREWLSE